MFNFFFFPPLIKGARLFQSSGAPFGDEAPHHFLNKPPVTRWRDITQQPPASHEPLVGCWPPFINVGEITHVVSDPDGQVMGSTHN